MNFVLFGYFAENLLWKSPATRFACPRDHVTRYLERWPLVGPLGITGLLPPPPPPQLGSSSRGTTRSRQHQQFQGMEGSHDRAKRIRVEFLLSLA